MRLPLGLSVPHAGLVVPRSLRDRFLLSSAEVRSDGDEGAAEIYDLRGEVVDYVRTSIARAVLDMNRAPDDDRRADGVFKTCSIWGAPVWREPLTTAERQWLLDAYHAPYHGVLARFGGRVKLAVDCHTMSDVGPPIGPDAGKKRPLVCLGDGQGTACPGSWIQALRECFARYFYGDVSLNLPFAGGHITRAMGRHSPWVQIELSRTDELSIGEKKQGVLRALRDWCGLDLPLEPYGTGVA